MEERGGDEVPGFRAAMKYAYSSTRVKAMESKLVRKEMLQKMLATKEAGSIAAMLLQTEYKTEIEKLGGVKAMDTLIDFALSRNLGRETSKLIAIAPKDQKRLMASIAGVWDVNNIRLALEAVGSGKSYEDISRYIIDTRYTGPAVVKDALAAKSVEGAADRLARKTPYGKLLESASDAYRRSHSALDAGAAAEAEYYRQLGGAIGRLEHIDRDAAALVKRRIDMRNVLAVMRAKRHGLEFSRVAPYMLPNGSIGVQRLEKIFKSARDVESIAESLKGYDFKRAIADYRTSKNKPLLPFEVAMHSDIFARALRSLRHSVLSFGAIVAFLYLKEVEVFTLRVLIKGKSYGLSDEEIKGMISWFR